MPESEPLVAQLVDIIEDFHLPSHEDDLRVARAVARAIEAMREAEPCTQNHQPVGYLKGFDKGRLDCDACWANMVAAAVAALKEGR